MVRCARVPFIGAVVAFCATWALATVERSVTYESRDLVYGPNISYWNHVTSQGGLCGKGYSESTVATFCSVSLQFTGIAISLDMVRSVNGTKVAIDLDGRRVDEIDTFLGNVDCTTPVFQWSGLEYGNHTIMISDLSDLPRQMRFEGFRYTTYTEDELAASTRTASSATTTPATSSRAEGWGRAHRLGIGIIVLLTIIALFVILGFILGCLCFFRHHRPGRNGQVLDDGIGVTATSEAGLGASTSQSPLGVPPTVPSGFSAPLQPPEGRLASVPESPSSQSQKGGPTIEQKVRAGGPPSQVVDNRQSTTSSEPWGGGPSSPTTENRQSTTSSEAWAGGPPSRTASSRPRTMITEIAGNRPPSVVSEAWRGGLASQALGGTIPSITIPGQGEDLRSHPLMDSPLPSPTVVSEESEALKGEQRQKDIDVTRPVSQAWSGGQRSDETRLSRPVSEAWGGGENNGRNAPASRPLSEAWGTGNISASGQEREVGRLAVGRFNSMN